MLRHELESSWPSLRPLVAAAVEPAGRHLAEDAYRAIAAGEWQLWAILEDDEAVAVVLTSIVRFPRRTELRIAGCAGAGMDRWVGLMETIEAYGMSKGCEMVQIQGRTGWARKLVGYDRIGVVLEKRL